MKTQLVPTVAWPQDPSILKRVRVRKLRPKIYAKKQPITEIDYFREAREQIAEMQRKRTQK